MENASFWNTSSTDDDHDNHDDHDDDDEEHNHLAPIRHVSLKVIYILIGSVGLVDNIFVLIVFIFFIKITAKVFHSNWLSCLTRVDKEKSTIFSRSAPEISLLN